jgi:hypothetical protein
MVEGGPPPFKLRRSFLILSSFAEALFFGVINVLVYEAPKELVVNNVLKIKIYILCLYNN